MHNNNLSSTIDIMISSNSEKFQETGNPNRFKNLRFQDVFDQIEWNSLSSTKIELNNSQIFKLERRYIKIALKSWVEESLRNALYYIKEKTFNIEQELRFFLAQLDSLESLNDISQLRNLSDNASRQISKWCGGQQLDLILRQNELFNTPYAINQVSICFHKFKTSCVNSLFSQCMESDSPKHLNFASALTYFLTFLNMQPERLKILDDNFIVDNVNDFSIQGKDLITLLIKRFRQHFSSIGQANENGDLFHPVNRLERLFNALEEVDWTEKFQSLIKEICRRILLPRVKLELKSEGGRIIVIVKGTVVAVSQIKEEMERKMIHLKAEEVQIVGLALVHVDCDLENDTWHGVNVAVITDKLVVVITKEKPNILWDVSGKNDDRNLKRDKAQNGTVSGEDGYSGEHGLPGESGGNIFIVCNEILNPEGWTIVSNGGRGKDGQDGGDGKDGRNMRQINQKLTLKKFEEKFPLQNSKENMATVLKSIERDFPSMSESESKDIRGDDYFFIKRNTIDGCSKITASLWKSNAFILIQVQGNTGEMGGRGGQGGQGGYGGIITIRKLNGELFVVPGLQINEEIQPTAVSTGARGPAGVDGIDGKGGKHGKTEKTGDFGIMHNINNNHSNSDIWKKGWNHFGFAKQDNRHFKIKYYPLNDQQEVKTKFFDHPYTKCNLDGKEALNYAVLCPTSVEDSEPTNIFINRYGREESVLVEAMKKKAITRQSLSHHSAKIIGRLSTIQHLVKMVKMHQLPLFDDELLTDNTDGILKPTQEEQAGIASWASAANNQQQQNLLDEDDEVLAATNQALVFRTSINSRHHASNSYKDDLKFPKRVKSPVRRSYCYNEQQTSSNVNIANEMQVLAEIDKNRPNSPLYSIKMMQNMASFLQKQPTFGDGKPSSFLNSSLGHVDDLSGLYVYKDGEDYIKQQLRKFIYNDYRINYNRNILKEFLFRFPVDDENNSKYKETLAVRKLCLDSEKKEQIWQNTKETQKQLRHEYLKLISSATLGLHEMLEISRPIQFSIFENFTMCGQKGIENYYNDDKQVAAEFIFKEIDFIPNHESIDVSDGRFILHKGNGFWQRLNLDSSMTKYFEQRGCQFKKLAKKVNCNKTNPSNTLDHEASSLNHHQQLLKWLENNNINNLEMITCIRMINPDYGATPDELSRLLLKHFRNGQQQLNQLVKVIPLLVERVMDYNNRYIEPIFYMHVVDNLSPIRWENEFLLFEMEERMKLVLKPEDRHLFRKYMYQLDEQKLFLLRDKLCATKNSENSLLVKMRMERTLEVLTEDDLNLNDKDIDDLENLSLNDWYFELTFKVWKSKIDKLSTESISLDEKKEAVYILVELTNKKGKEACYQLIQKNLAKAWPEIFKQLQHENSDTAEEESSTETMTFVEDRKVEVIISKIEQEAGGNTSKQLASKLPDIKSSLLIVEDKLDSDNNYKHLVQDAMEINLAKLVNEYRESILSESEIIRRLVRLNRFPDDSFFKLRKNIWKKVVELLFTESGTESTEIEDKNEAIYLFIELANRKGDIFCNQFIINSLRPPAKTWPEIFKQLDLLQQNVTSNEIVTLIQEITKEDVTCVNVGDPDANKILKKLFELTNKALLTLPPKTYSRILSKKYKKEIQRKKENHQDQVDKDDKEQFLHAFVYAVQVKMGIRLRDTQRVAIITLLSISRKKTLDDYITTNNVLAQVSTGEGKSLIVAALAIYYALHYNKVDVITSNNVLAKRDSSLSIENGGLKELYDIFNVDVAHNCSEADYDRVKAYDSVVVYGELSNFQRDYLLDKCYGRNIRGDRKFDCVIVDEVDCMLLDRGNNMLYLSHDIPGMEMLESLYVFIWENIPITAANLNFFESVRGRTAIAAIKSAVLYDLYGTITIDDLLFVHGSLKDQQKEKETIWFHLIEKNVIDQQGRLLIEDVNVITEELFSYSKNPELNPKLVFFFRNVFERKRHIQIPQHLLSFVDRHLDTFLENALRALALNANEHYVVDHNRANIESLDSNPQVIIIDPDTGTDQTTSQWDGGLHQFLQFKEGCRLTLQNFKSVFISNFTYIKRYKNLIGLSGTLGSQPERIFLQEMYECDYFTLPTSRPKRFVIESAIVVRTEESWLEEVTKEAKRIVEEGRSLVIFCRTIKIVQTVYQKLRSSSIKNIRTYKREYDNFTIGNKIKMDVGQVIVATNLAGRGTDIEISENLRKNGGLHICVTYLPENVRIEEQVLGRAGRKGDPGSGKLILYEPDETEYKEAKWPAGKIFDMKMKRNRQEMQRISQLTHDFFAKFDKEEKCFDLFWKHYEMLRKKLTENIKDSAVREVDIICNSVLDSWVLWLDKFNDGSNLFETLPLGELLCLLVKEVIDKFPRDIFGGSQHCCQMSPVHSIAMAKHLATRKKSPNLEKAASLLDEIVKSKDCFLYPSAYYYRAFVYVNKKGGLAEKKNEFVQLLRTTESLLEQQISNQITYAISISQVKNVLTAINKNLFHPIEAYKEQKINMVKLLWYYIRTIQSILGIPCTASSLEKVGIDDTEKAEMYFNSLVNGGWIGCQVNDPESVPNRDLAIQRIGKKYKIDNGLLDNFLSKIRKEPRRMSEQELEIQIQESGLINRTRRTFWNLLVDENALILSDSEKQPRHVPDLKDMGSKYVIFNPTLEKIDDLLEGKKRLEDFEYAKIDTTALKTVDLTQFGQLTKPDDLSVTNIASNEWDKLWQALIDQKIIDDEGKLLKKTTTVKFNYPDCPIYEHAVISLVERTYCAEIIRHQWLDENDPIRRLHIINYLPLEPCKDLLYDLQAANIVSGHKVTDRYFSLMEVVKKVTTVTDESTKKVTKNKEDREKIGAFLKNHQALYASIETLVIKLVFIDHDILKNNNNILEQVTTELSTLSLVGFNHVIKISEEKRSKKMILRSSVILFSGGALMGLSVLPFIFLEMEGLLGFFIAESAGLSFLFKKGIGNIIFAISTLISGNHLTWDDVSRRILSDTSLYFPEKLKPGWSDAKQRFANFFEYGFKSVGPSFQPQQVTQHTTTSGSSTQNTDEFRKMITSFLNKVGQTLSIGRLNEQVDSKVKDQLQIICESLKGELIAKIKENVDIKFSSAEMTKTIDELYKFKEWYEVENDVKEQINRVVANWADTANYWLEKVMHFINSKMRKILVANESQLPFGVNVERKSQEMTHQDIVKSIKEILDEIDIISVLGVLTIKRQLELLHDELNSFISRTIDSNIPRVHTTKSENSKKEMIKHMKSTLNEQAEIRMIWFRDELLVEATKHVTALNTQVAKRIYQERVANPVADVRDCLEKKEQDQNKDNQVSNETSTVLKVSLTSDKATRAQQSGHIQLCLNLMKKTNDPILLAALIREGRIPHDDPFCENGLQVALKFIQNINPHLLTIDAIKSSEEAATLIETDSSISNAIRFGWRKYAKKMCPFELYPILEHGCSDSECELRGLTEYPGYILYVKQAFIGKSNADSYENVRKLFLQQEAYQYVIWLTIKTFMLPVAERLKNTTRKKQLFDAALKHFQDYSRFKKDSKNVVITQEEVTELKERLEHCIL